MRERVLVASGLLVREGRVLLVASRYANRAEPVWFLPGGRQREGELFHDTVTREVCEETGLQARVMSLCYLAESFSPERHVINAVFAIEADGIPRPPANGNHVTDIDFIPVPALRKRIGARVMWEPLFAYLCETLPMRYAGYANADISLTLPDEL